MNKVLKSSIAMALGILSFGLAACGCAKDSVSYASISRTPDNTGGTELTFSYDEDSHTAWFGGEGETIAYYPENAGIGRSAGNRVGITVTAPEEITEYEGFKLTIYDDQVYEGLTPEGKPTAFDGDNYMYIYPLVSESQKEVSIKIKWNNNCEEQEYMVKVVDGTTFATA